VWAIVLLAFGLLMAGVVFVPFVRRRMWEERERNQSRSQTPI
jgi:hypothetical protein